MMCDIDVYQYYLTFPEQWLATAATNGAVVLWNIHRSMKLKQETVFTDHKRTVNKVFINRLFNFQKLQYTLPGHLSWVRTAQSSFRFSRWHNETF